MGASEWRLAVGVSVIFLISYWDDEGLISELMHADTSTSTLSLEQENPVQYCQSTAISSTLYKK